MYFIFIRYDQFNVGKIADVDVLRVQYKLNVKITTNTFEKTDESYGLPCKFAPLKARLTERQKFPGCCKLKLITD